jgi:hypothetical protein
MKKLVPVFMVALLFLVGCYPGAPITCTGPSQQPSIISFNAEPSSISAGESSDLSWNVSGATTVSIDQGIGNVALTGTRSVAPAVTTVYTLTALSSAGTATATTQVIVTGAAPPPTPTGVPVINYFTASPSSISLGGSATLSWNVSNATSVTIDNGVGSVGSSGSTSVLPTATTVFTLTASNAAGSATATALVSVSGAPSPPAGLPVIDYFTATPPIISSGGSTTLSWSVSNATSVAIDNGVGSVALSGSMPVSPAASTNYTLTASNSYGWRTMTVPVLVTGGGPTVAYDFVQQASTAYWWTKVGATFVDLPFPGSTGDNRGFATYQYNVKLNDGNTYTKVLETHPQWVDNGWISGKYSGVYVPPGAKLRIKVGLIQGASAGNVTFNIGKLGDPATINTNVFYAGGVKVLESDLSAYAGQTIDFVLNVNANGSSAQDWAAWAEAQIIY